MWSKAAAVGNAGASGALSTVAAGAPQAHRPHVHSPAGRAAPGPPLALEHASHMLLMFNGFGAGFAQAAKDHLFGPL